MVAPQPLFFLPRLDIMARRRPAFRPSLNPLEPRDVPALVGGLDAAFDGDGRLIADLGGTDVINAVALQGDGKIVSVGTNGADFFISRLNPDGSADTSFNGTGRKFIDFGGNDVATSVVIDGVGRIVVAGFTSNGTKGAVARLTSAGATDLSFNATGQNSFNIVSNTKLFDIALRPDGSNNVVVAGLGFDDDFGVAQLRGDNGQLDTGFNGTGTRAIPLGGTEQAQSVLIQPADGKVVLVGWSTNGNKAAVIRLSTDGTTVDAAFGNTTLNGNKAFQLGNFAESKAFAAEFDSAGSIVIVGRSGPDATADSLAFRIDANGTGVANIQSVDLGGADEFRDLDIDALGRIAAIGFARPGATSDFSVARFAANLSGFDGTFGTNGKVNGEFNAAVEDKAFGGIIDSNGKIVIVGSVGGDAAAARLHGAVGSQVLLAAGGATNGSAELFVPNAAFNLYTSPGTSKTVIPGSTANARVATADVNGDGIPDIIAGAGPGGASTVTVTDGATGVPIATFNVFEATFTGGVYVAAGDMDNDGKAEVLVTPDQSGGPLVAIYSGSKLAAGQTGDAAQIVRFFGINDPGFRGGARAALGDINNDGFLDLIVSAGFLGGPRIAVYSGQQIITRAAALQAQTFGDGTFQLVTDFLAFEESVRNGAFVGAGDIDGDGNADLIFGGGPTGGPRVRIASGKQLLTIAGLTTLDAAAAGNSKLQLANFNAGDANSRGGVRVTSRDLDMDNRAELVVGSGDGLAAQVLVYKGASVLANGNSAAGPAIDQTLTPFGGGALANGVFVG